VESGNVDQRVIDVTNSFLKAFCILVETPEAACPLTKYGNKKKNEEKRREWLSGLIDGDGCFLISKTGYCSLEITTHIKDESLLVPIKQLYGGSLKPRAGYNAIRYRLHHREGLLFLCKDVNGLIRNPVRTEQFQKVCNKLELNYIKPKETLLVKNGWFAGMFDADGTVTLNFINKTSPQITISVTQKYIEIPQMYKQAFGGSLFFDKSQNGYYTWAVQSKDNVLALIEYFKHYPCRSSKHNKLLLIPTFYTLIEQRAYRPSDLLLHKKWQFLVKKWQMLSFLIYSLFSERYGPNESACLLYAWLFVSILKYTF
jgi:hypothetical protein